MVGRRKQEVDRATFGWPTPHVVDALLERRLMTEYGRVDRPWVDGYACNARMATLKLVGEQSDSLPGENSLPVSLLRGEERERDSKVQRTSFDCPYRCIGLTEE